MKKLIVLVVSLVIAGVLFAACGSKSGNSEEGKIQIVTTIFPEYDWVSRIAEGNENIEVNMLLDKGVDLHSFQPSADDIIKVSSCDMFIYVGGESDEWVEDALLEATNKDMVVINLLDVLGDSVKEEEVVEGMEAEEEEEGESEEEEVEYDEHVWLSLKNAQTLCGVIADELISMDSDNKNLYEKNLKNYTEQLTSLDKEYEKAVDEALYKTVLFGDRFPFGYLVDDYGLDYYAAFVGCSAESEASFETIVFLANKIDEIGLNAILQIESADGSIAQTIVDNTKNKNQKILTMDSMQSVTSKDVNEGMTYLGIMENNLEVLKEALN